MNYILRNLLSAKTVIYMGFFVVLGFLAGYLRDIKKIPILIDLNTSYRESIHSTIKKNPSIIEDNYKYQLNIPNIKKDPVTKIESDIDSLKESAVSSLLEKKESLIKLPHEILVKQKDKVIKPHKDPFVSSLYKSNDVPSTKSIVHQVMENEKRKEEKSAWDNIKAFFQSKINPDVKPNEDVKSKEISSAKKNIEPQKEQTPELKPSETKESDIPKLAKKNQEKTPSNQSAKSIIEKQLKDIDFGDENIVDDMDIESPAKQKTSVS